MNFNLRAGDRKAQICEFEDIERNVKKFSTREFYRCQLQTINLLL